MKKYLINSDEPVLSDEAYGLLNSISECAQSIDNLNLNSCDNPAHDKAMRDTAVAFVYFVHCAIENIKVHVETDIEFRLSQPEKEEQP